MRPANPARHPSQSGLVPRASSSGIGVALSPGMMTETMLIALGSRLAPLVWGGMVYAVAGGLAILTAAVCELRPRRPTFRLDLRARKIALDTADFDEAA